MSLTFDWWRAEMAEQKKMMRRCGGEQEEEICHLSFISPALTCTFVTDGGADAPGGTPPPPAPPPPILTAVAGLTQPPSHLSLLWTLGDDWTSCRWRSRSQVQSSNRTGQTISSSGATPPAPTRSTSQEPQPGAPTRSTNQEPQPGAPTRRTNQEAQPWS